jgi:uncharacterized protein (TIGR03086 family)
MSTQHIVAAVAADTADLIRGLPADRRHAPTPCRDWNAATLTGHLHQVVAALDLAGHGGPIPAALWQEDCAGATIGADWAAPPEKIDMGGMPMPGGTVVAMLVGDLVLHGWDLARAAGRSYTARPEAVEMTYRFLTAFAEQGRGMGLFAEPVPVPADAPLLDRALGLSGRDPAWCPRR